MARLAAALTGTPHDDADGQDPLTAVDELIIAGTLHKAGMPERRPELIGANSTEQRIDMMLRLGPFGEWNSGTLNLQVLLDNPHGVDLGPLKPKLPGNLRTESKRVELAPQPLLDDVVRLRARLADAAPDVVLIGRRQLRSNNSWMHNIPTLVSGSNKCTLHINPADVARLGLGDNAVVKSAAGALTVPLEPTEAIMPGVVSLPHGWGHTDSTQTVAREHAGVNANVLTDDSVVDVPSGNAVFNGVPVTLTPA
jgi:anaerobic selenocysteine-containing dehydrogenase